MSVQAQVVNFVDRPMPGGLPRQPMRVLLGAHDPAYVPILRDPEKAGEDADAVFYFPGCGSERLFSQVGLATLAMLYHVGAETVLPPGYLCCGYPQAAGGDAERAQRISTANQVLFHRIANTLNYLDIRTILVSCGTCLDQLTQYRLQQIFPGSRLLDIHEYLLEKGISVAGDAGVEYLYHDPCHSPIKTADPLQVTSQLVGKPVRLSDRCCGEAGTFAVSRPDIATQVRFRKQEELEQGMADARALNPESKVKVLTSCPACLQGLWRYRNDVDVEPDYIVTELAGRILGEDWQKRFVAAVNRGGVERVLL
jgi:Fe-S oxidoreductase